MSKIDYRLQNPPPYCSTGVLSVNLESIPRKVVSNELTKMFYRNSECGASPRRVHPREWDYPNAEYSYILSSQSDPGDGMWICKCKRENTLTLYTGSSPFSTVSCENCDRIPTVDSRITDILTILPETVYSYAMVSAWPNLGSVETPYGSICPCGRSHRACIAHSETGKNGESTVILNFRIDDCSCGGRYNKAWTRFYIGSCEAYHRDPMAAYGTLLERHIEWISGNQHWRHPAICPLEDWCPLMEKKPNKFQKAINLLKAFKIRRNT